MLISRIVKYRAFHWPQRGRCRARCFVPDAQTWQGPRIDPTGERFFVWPNSRRPLSWRPPSRVPRRCLRSGSCCPPPTAPGTGAPQCSHRSRYHQPLRCRSVTFRLRLCIPIPPTPPIAPPPGGDYSAGTVCSWGGCSVVAAGDCHARSAQCGAGGWPGSRDNRASGTRVSSLTPDRFVAPVGTQVLLKAGVVGADGYLAANQRIEWSVARNGSRPTRRHGTRRSDPTPGMVAGSAKDRRMDGHGYHGVFPRHIGRKSARSERRLANRSWRNVGSRLASATEGTSRVTAYAPDQREFNQATRPFIGSMPSGSSRHPPWPSLGGRKF